MNGNRNARLRLAMSTLVAIVALQLAAGVSMTHAAWAQASPAATAAPRPLVHVPIPIPVNPPKGWDPKQWASLREKCQELVDKGRSGLPLTFSEMTTLETCHTLMPYPASVTREPSQPQSQPHPPVLLPTPTASPESSLSDPSGTTPIGPYGTPIIADSEDACVAAQGEPPDLAADVSPTETNCQFY
jgi:hypothetical protein